ncbi:MAG: shikimate kinase [Flavobacteriales bacterium]
MPRTPIFLVGFMCSGKTRVGRELAQLLGSRHIDLDRRIEEQVGPLQVYFARQGEAAFRDLEREVLLGLLDVRDAVISTGGGTAMAFDNMQRMRSVGTVVHLDVAMDELMPRIVRSGGDRPLLMGLKGVALEERVVALLAERSSGYALAQIKVDGSGQASAVAARIAAALAAQVK